MTDKEKIDRISPFGPGIYNNIDLDHLVIYAVGQLQKIKADLSFENAVAITFKLFPEKFSLLGFPSFPDAKRVHDCLFRCTYKTKQWLGGKTRQGFIITERSRIYIKEADDLLRGRLKKKSKAPSKTRRKEVILSDVSTSAAFRKYQAGLRNDISDAEFCFLLQGTLDSSPETLGKNLISLKRFASELQERNVMNFLIWLEQNFRHRLPKGS
ncbi:MAG: hypothetical protein A2W25_09225 [candidate division Zixibacteria bacterium RBG_16_53_22]|nr:MAG: hypothetical protein A2W25_09225 [candidate division Zixibacteria bacterium RBG_16_53_22]